MKYHYTYRITNIKINKHYYGVRTSKDILPKNDLGIKYFSSSSNKQFILDQKSNPQNYKYKIIKIFDTRVEAIELEIKLHNKFDVGINESFYNKSKQTSTGFDNISNPESMLKSSVTKHKIQSNGLTNAQNGANKANYTKSKKNKNGICIYDIITEKASKTKKTTILDNGLNLYEEVGRKNKIKMSIIQSNGLTMGQCIGIKSALTRTINNNLPIADKNPQAKQINIYDNNNILMYKCFGNFQEICKLNDLPYSSLGKSHRNNGKLLFQTKQGIKIATINGNEKFIGWYAIDITKLPIQNEEGQKN